MTDTDDPAPRRRRLPDVALPPAPGGDPVPLRVRRQGSVLVLLTREPRERDRAYLRALADAEPAIRGWDGRVLVIVPAAAAAPPDLPALPLPVVVDAAGTVAAAAGVTAPALVIADQWGEVYASAEASGDAPWLAPAEVEQWLRFLSIRCAG